MKTGELYELNFDDGCKCVGRLSLHTRDNTNLRFAEAIFIEQEHGESIFDPAPCLAGRNDGFFGYQFNSIELKEVLNDREGVTSIRRIYFDEEMAILKARNK